MTRICQSRDTSGGFGWAFARFMFSSSCGRSRVLFQAARFFYFASIVCQSGLFCIYHARRDVPTSPRKWHVCYLTFSSCIHTMIPSFYISIIKLVTFRTWLHPSRAS
ncbi:hypothetical protein K456DRAFT_1554094 [Colletotrichum gloeosporioides 23]|nr:hypothetical protein K456DRAFT_1554094 [Colletotrichum gloeosporioides 23]